MFSISLASCEVKEFREDATHFVEKINTVLHTLGSDSSLSVDGMEIIVLEAMHSLCQMLLEMSVLKQASEQVAGSVECPQCQQACRPYRKRVRHITTLCGVIRVERWVYRCASGHYHFPWDTKEKLKGQYTHRVAEVMCRLAARLDFREASEELSRQGIEVSHTILNQNVREWSKAFRVTQQVDTQKLEANQRWYVSCDGCYTNSPDGWTEVKTGSIYRDYPQYGSRAKASVRTPSIRYVASRNNAEHFGKELYALATNSGIYQEDIDTREVVFIGDDAAWIWNLANEYFPNAVEIVDHMHATSHLYNVAKHAFGEMETAAIETWIKETAPLLYDGNNTEVAPSIRALATQRPEVSDRLEREARYYAI